MDSAAQSLKQDQAATGKLQRPRNPIPWGKIIIYIVLGIGTIAALLPFLWMISSSLMTLGEVAIGKFIPSVPQFENYPEAWRISNFGQYMWNSVRITGISIAGTLLFGIPAAYAFARMNFIGKNVVFGIMLTTLMIPEVVTFIPNFLTVTWIDRLGESVCGEACKWINNWPSLTVPFMASAFSIFLLRQFFMQIPQDLWDAAQIDGASHVRFLISVVVPLSKAPIMTIVTFTFIGSWNSLLWPLLVTSTDDWRPVAVGLQQFASSDAPGAFHLQMAAAVIMTLPILIMYFFTQKQFTEGIASSGLKGV